jgi:hypothetical protein
MSDVGRATTHDEAEHYLRRAVLGIPQRHALFYRRSRNSFQENLRSLPRFYAPWRVSILKIVNVRMSWTTRLHDENCDS